MAKIVGSYYVVQITEEDCVDDNIYETVDAIIARDAFSVELRFPKRIALESALLAVSRIRDALPEVVLLLRVEGSLSDYSTPMIEVLKVQ